MRRFGVRRDGRGEKRRQCTIGPVKRFLGVLAGGLGLAALWRRRRREPVAAVASPADELRAKLAESKAVVEERDAFEGGETTVDAAPDPAARRRDVHERARASLDELGH
jgi:MYXO-CTERM domain-containing protein